MTYAQRVIQAYEAMPFGPGRATKKDWRVAWQLERSGVPFSTIKTAMAVAILYRTRPIDPDLPPGPIYSLRYIAAIVERLRADPPDPGYLAYLRSCLSRDLLGLPTGGVYPQGAEIAPESPQEPLRAPGGGYPP